MHPPYHSGWSVYGSWHQYSGLPDVPADWCYGSAPQQWDHTVDASAYVDTAAPPDEYSYWFAAVLFLSFADRYPHIPFAMYHVAFQTNRPPPERFACAHEESVSDRADGLPFLDPPHPFSERWTQNVQQFYPDRYPPCNHHCCPAEAENRSAPECRCDLLLFGRNGETAQCHLQSVRYQIQGYPTAMQWYSSPNAANPPAE